MSPRVIVTSKAEEDILAIWEFIADDSLTAADSMVRRIDEVFLRLVNAPQLGAPRDDIRDGVREFVVGSYVVFYRPVDEGIEVWRVLHGARKVDRFL